MKTASTKKRSRVTVRHVGLAGLKRKLAGFEKKYGMSTPAFVKKVWRGELDESKDFIMWLAFAEIHHDIMNGSK
jgi:hypothetical protein